MRSATTHHLNTARFEHACLVMVDRAKEQMRDTISKRIRLHILSLTLIFLEVQRMACEIAFLPIIPTQNFSSPWAIDGTVTYVPNLTCDDLKRVAFLIYCPTFLGSPSMQVVMAFQRALLGRISFDSNGRQNNANHRKFFVLPAFFLHTRWRNNFLL